MKPQPNPMQNSTTVYGMSIGKYLSPTLQNAPTIKESMTNSNASMPARSFSCPSVMMSVQTQGRSARTVNSTSMIFLKSSFETHTTAYINRDNTT
eukprot:m.93469 g.93469  ORF g.93469 m.93469 type:complete len:95 (-) comp26639_c0_seq2:82-366(-)